MSSNLTQHWLQYNEAAQQLQATLGRSANLVAEYSEWLAHQHYGGELLPVSHPSADIDCGRLVQVKARKVDNDAARGQLSTFRSWDFATLCVIIYRPDGSLLRAGEMPCDAAMRYAKRQGHVNGSYIVTTAAFWADPELRDITAELRAAGGAA